MRGIAKMMAVTAATKKRESDHRDYDRHEMAMPYMGGDYDTYDRFRDRRGREHYDNGRYAPRNEWDGGMRDNYPWYNYPRSEGNEMRYNYPDRIGDGRGSRGARSDMDEMESRRRRDRRGRFRSEMDEDDPGMHYPGPYPFPPPVYEEYNRPNQIGFSSYGGEEKEGLHMIRGGGSGHTMKLDKEMAEEWMESLENEDGTIGPHWTMEQAKQLMAQKGLSLDPLEFYVALNAVYSDYCGVAKKSNVNNVDFYINMAKAFIEDKDSQPNRLARYYTYVAKH